MKEEIRKVKEEIEEGLKELVEHEIGEVSFIMTLQYPGKTKGCVSGVPSMGGSSRGVFDIICRTITDYAHKLGMNASHVAHLIELAVNKKDREDGNDPNQASEKEWMKLKELIEILKEDVDLRGDEYD